MSQDATKIHEVVQVRYGAIARGTSQSCCGSSSDCCGSDSNASGLYSVDMIATLPTEVTSLSLG